MKQPVSELLSQGNTTSAHKMQKAFIALIASCAGVSVLISFGVLFSMIFESIRFFSDYSLFNFLFGTHWARNLAVDGEKADKPLAYCP